MFYRHGYSSGINRKVLVNHRSSPKSKNVHVHGSIGVFCECACPGDAPLPNPFPARSRAINCYFMRVLCNCTCNNLEASCSGANSIHT